MGITESYTGADATVEIVIMLLVACIIGWMLRWAWEVLNRENLRIAHEVREYQASPTVQATVTDPAPTTENQPIVMPHAAPAPVYASDDLKIIEGVGPKIESLLKDGGLSNWAILAETDAADIKTLLRAAGERYRIHDPSTWPEQAQLAHAGKWDELREFQAALSGGKDLTRIYK